MSAGNPACCDIVGGPRPPLRFKLIPTLERVRVRLPFDKWCRDLDTDPGFSIEPLLWTDIDEMRRLPFRDPFDRMIVGTAKRLRLPIITKDTEITDSALVETVW